MQGMPAAAEEVDAIRDCALAELTGARIHLRMFRRGRDRRRTSREKERTRSDMRSSRRITGH
jgi:hypothetical protein